MSVFNSISIPERAKKRLHHRRVFRHFGAAAMSVGMALALHVPAYSDDPTSSEITLLGNLPISCDVNTTTDMLPNVELTQGFPQNVGAVNWRCNHPFRLKLESQNVRDGQCFQPCLFWDPPGAQQSHALIYTATFEANRDVIAFPGPCVSGGQCPAGILDQQLTPDDLTFREIPEGGVPLTVEIALSSPTPVGGGNYSDTLVFTIELN